MHRPVFRRQVNENVVCIPLRDAPECHYDRLLWSPYSFPAKDMRRARTALLLVLPLAGFAAMSARLLVVNDPSHADVILVLAGEADRRPQRGIELLNSGFAPRMILDVPASAKIYQWTQPELAAKYVEGLPEGKQIILCPIAGLSTKAESRDAQACLQQAGAHRVLLVTSDYHTRRALSIFRHELEGYEFRAAAAYDPREFGVSWWTQREWAKVNVGEWARLLWWQAVDRWN
jgi:uncharacterized SAM-binding protein YcdF (DUF218 family)